GGRDGQHVGATAKVDMAGNQSRGDRVIAGTGHHIAADASTVAQHIGAVTQQDIPNDASSARVDDNVIARTAPHVSADIAAIDEAVIALVEIDDTADMAAILDRVGAD